MQESFQAYDPLAYENIAKSIVNALLEQRPVPLSPLDQFSGVGVYALYYGGDFPLYAPIAGAECRFPIYVGKALPTGTRTGTDALDPPAERRLWSRLRQHARSIHSAGNLRVNDFLCRYLVVKYVWTALVEQVMIRRFQPLWNSTVDGFGNHAPGRGRINMRRPRWDILHPGRGWAERLVAEETADGIAADVREHLNRMGETVG